MWGSVLLFMIAVLGTLAAAAIAALLQFRGRTRIAWRLVKMLGLCGALYALSLLVVALISDPKLIALGGEKHICEIDCHVAYSVLDVDTMDALSNMRPAAGNVFQVVTVRTRFDRSTASNSRAPDLPLSPGDRDIQVFDRQGNTYLVSAAGQAALREPKPSPRMLTRSLKAGEEFTAKLVFEVPRTASGLVLLIQDTDFTKWVLIGSETFPLHAKALFRLDAGPGVQTVPAD